MRGIGKPVFCLSLAMLVPAWGQTQISSIAALRALGARSAALGHVVVAGYYGAGAGGGRFDWQPGNTAKPDGCLVFAADGVAAGRWVRAGGNRRISVLDCGARGDGETDDAGAEQAALSTVATGGIVAWPAARCYRTTTTLLVERSLTLSGPGQLCWSRQDYPGIKVTAGDVTFERLSLLGPQYAAYHSGETGIDISGTFHPGSAPGYIGNVVIRNCTVANWGDTGVLMTYVDGFSYSGNAVKRAVYAGIGLQSVRHGEVKNNNIAEITGSGTPGNNAYGVYVSRSSNDAGNLVSQPRSTDVTLSGNTVDRVLTWSGLDTHGGERIKFLNNKVTNTEFGIAVGSSRDSAGGYAYAPHDAVVSGNSLDAGTVTGHAAYGITVTGAETDLATASVSYNTVTGFGPGDQPTGAANLGETKGVVFSHNLIRDPSPYGIFLAGENHDLSVTDNTVVDPWTDSAKVGSAVGLRSVGNNNTVYIARNSFRRDGRQARYLLSTESGLVFYFSTGTGNRVTLDNNQSDVSMKIYDQAKAIQPDSK